MKRIVLFLNTAILALFASCIILLFGGIEYLTADLNQPVNHQEPAQLIDEYEEDLNPRSDYFFPRDNVFEGHDAHERIDL